MSLGKVRLDGDRLPIGGNCLLELALVFQRIAEVGMSLGIVRLDADRLPIGGNCLLELALVGQRTPRL